MLSRPDVVEFLAHHRTDPDVSEPCLQALVIFHIEQLRFNEALFCVNESTIPTDGEGMVRLISYCQLHFMLPKVIAVARAVLEQEPESIYASNALAVALFNRGQMDEARAEVSRYCRLLAPREQSALSEIRLRWERSKNNATR